MSFPSIENRAAIIGEFAYGTTVTCDRSLKYGWVQIGSRSADRDPVLRVRTVASDSYITGVLRTSFLDKGGRE